MGEENDKVTELKGNAQSSKERALAEIWKEKRKKLDGEMKTAVSEFVGADEARTKALAKVDGLQTQIDELESQKPVLE